MPRSALSMVGQTSIRPKPGPTRPCLKPAVMGVNEIAGVQPVSRPDEGSLGPALQGGDGDYHLPFHSLTFITAAIAQAGLNVLSHCS